MAWLLLSLKNITLFDKAFLHLDIPADSKYPLLSYSLVFGSTTTDHREGVTLTKNKVKSKKSARPL